jgi:hypothetical protein
VVVIVSVRLRVRDLRVRDLRVRDSITTTTTITAHAQAHAHELAVPKVVLV